jgi:hypothetical protein
VADPQAKESSGSQELDSIVTKQVPVGELGLFFAIIREE